MKIAVSWAYAPSYVKPMSVPQGLIMLMTRFGMNVTLAHPPEYTLMDEPMRLARENAERSGGQFNVVDSMEEAFADADIVYPKSWGPETLYGEQEGRRTSPTEKLGRGSPVRQARRSHAGRTALPAMDLRRRHDDESQGIGHLHALPAGGPRRRSQRRGHRRPAVSSLSGGRESPAHCQGTHGTDDVKMS